MPHPGPSSTNGFANSREPAYPQLEGEDRSLSQELSRILRYDPEGSLQLSEDCQWARLEAILQHTFPSDAGPVSHDRLLDVARRSYRGQEPRFQIRMHLNSPMVRATTKHGFRSDSASSALRSSSPSIISPPPPKSSCSSTSAASSEWSPLSQRIVAEPVFSSQTTPGSAAMSVAMRSASSDLATTPASAAVPVCMPPLQDRLCVSGCSDISVARLIEGIYLPCRVHHKRQAYSRIHQETEGEMFVYFWDDQTDNLHSGWWIGPEIGSNQVWARACSLSQLPPQSSWQVPWNGPVDQSFTATLGSFAVPAGWAPPLAAPSIEVPAPTISPSAPTFVDPLNSSVPVCPGVAADMAEASDTILPGNDCAACNITLSAAAVMPDMIATTALAPSLSSPMAFPAVAAASVDATDAVDAIAHCFRAAGCEILVLRDLVEGDYFPMSDGSMHHGRRLFRREASGEQSETYLYFWDGLDEAGYRGWWLGQEPGGACVYGHAPFDGEEPPKVGWRLPSSGSVDEGFELLALPYDQDALAIAAAEPQASSTSRAATAAVSLDLQHAQCPAANEHRIAEPYPDPLTASSPRERPCMENAPQANPNLRRTEKYVFLIRHAESKWNVLLNGCRSLDIVSVASSAGVVTDVDHGLSDNGAQQVERLRGKIRDRITCTKGNTDAVDSAQRFQNAFECAKRSTVYCSPLRRAVQTAGELLPRQDGWNVIKLVREAREIKNYWHEKDCVSSPGNLGSRIAESAGLGEDAAARVDAEDCMEQWWTDTCEDPHKAQARVALLWDRLMESEGTSCVVVTHSNLIKQLAQLLAMRRGDLEDEAASECGLGDFHVLPDTPSDLLRARNSKLCNCGVLGLRCLRRPQLSPRPSLSEGSGWQWVVEDAMLMFSSRFEEEEEKEAAGEPDDDSASDGGLLVFDV